MLTFLRIWLWKYRYPDWKTTNYRNTLISFYKHTGKSGRGSICLAKSHFQPEFMLIYMLRLQLVDFLWIIKFLSFKSKHWFGSKTENFLCNLAPQAKIFGLRKLNELQSNPKKVNVLEKLHDFFCISAWRYA